MPTPHDNNNLLFFDDFTSNELDRSKWNVEITGGIMNDEQQAYIDSPETIYLQQEYDSAHGVLVIHPRYRKGYITPQGNSFDFVSGRINTRAKFEFTHGSVAARIRLPVGAGLWPAFWTMGAEGRWPACGEMDIMECVGEQDWTGVAVHGPGYSGETPLVNKKYFPQPIDVTQWHIYSLDWTSNDLLFEIDGELVYRVTRPMVEFYGKWVFDGSNYLIFDFALGGTYPFKTSGLASPYYGLPEATVQAIRRDEVKLLVDWVKVARL
ncbi:MAG: glycoside hydrolase family 16 protein [Chloroflexi bacterium]|nr:glycoside hydrolase family 16 protein [Chloroflexota bacterium]